MLKRLLKIKEQRMSKFDHDSFYIWDVEAFDKPKDYTPKNENDINRVINLLETFEDNHTLPTNLKFAQFGEICLQLLKQYQHNFDEYTTGNFRNIVDNVSRSQQHHNNCYIRFDKDDFDFQQLSETVFIFQKACEKVGLMMMDTSPFDPVVFYPDGKTKPKQIAAQLEAFVLSEKDQIQDSDELPSNKAKVQKMFKPKFDKIAQDYGFFPLETTHPNYKQLTKITKNVYINHMPISYIILQFDIDKLGNGGYEIFCSGAYHCLKLEEIVAKVDNTFNLLDFEVFARNSGVNRSTNSKLELENQLKKVPNFLESLLAINTYTKIEEQMVACGLLMMQEGKTKIDLFESVFKNDIEKNYFSFIILMRLANDPLYEIYKTKFIELRELRLDWQSRKVSEEEKKKILLNWNKLIEILDNLPGSKL